MRILFVAPPTKTSNEIDTLRSMPDAEIVVVGDTAHHREVDIALSSRRIPVVGSPERWTAALAWLVGLQQVDPGPVDIVMSTELFSPVSAQAARLARRLGAAHFVLVQEILDTNPLYRIPPWHWYAGHTTRRLDGVLCSTPRGFRHAINRGVAADRIIVIPPGVDTEHFSPAPHPPDNATAVFVGELRPDKGIIDVIAAADRAQPLIGPAFRLKVVGDGQLRGRVQRLARTRPWLDVVGKVPRSDVPAILRSGRAFVLAPRTRRFSAEQFGFASVEAMACGLPIVTTRCGAVPEVVPSHNFIVDERDIDGMADGLHRALSADGPRLGALNRAHVRERFDLAHQGTALRDELEDLLRKVTAEEQQERTIRIPFDAKQDAIIHSERRWPMTVHVEVALDGRLDRARLEDAFVTAVARRPMATARRTRPRWWTRTYQWEVRPPAVAASALTFTSDQIERVRDSWLSEKIRLEDAPPFRALVAPSADGTTRIALHAHHVAMDGVGAAVLLGEVLQAYGTGVVPDDVVQETPEDAPRGIKPIVDAFREVSTAPRANRLEPATPAPVSAQSVFVLDRLSAEETTLLRAARVSAPHASLNDVLVAALHRAVDAWIGESGQVADVISITVPVSSMPRSLRTGTLRNAVLQARTMTRPRDRIDEASTLRCVDAQTKAMKVGGTASAPAVVLGELTFLPVGVRRLLPPLVSWLTRDRYLDTMRLSNLGAVDIGVEADGSTVRGVWFTPPVRHPQGLNVGVAEHGGALHLGFRACHGPWTQESVRRFASTYREQLGLRR